MTLNKVLLIGNLGSDPEMRYTPNGNAVCDFRMAVNRRYTTSEGEQREETDWFRVTAWGRLAEQVNQYLQKGRRTYVEGRISSSAYIDREGQARASLEVTAEKVLFLDPRSATYDESGAAPPDSGSAAAAVQSASGGSAPVDGEAAAEDVEELPW